MNSWWMGLRTYLATHWAYPYIMELYDFFGTSGCSQDPLMYCPDLFVTREQMATFIVRLFGGEPPPTIVIRGSRLRM